MAAGLFEEALRASGPGAGTPIRPLMAAAVPGRGRRAGSALGERASPGANGRSSEPAEGLEGRLLAVAG